MLPRCHLRTQSLTWRATLWLVDQGKKGVSLRVLEPPPVIDLSSMSSNHCERMKIIFYIVDGVSTIHLGFSYFRLWRSIPHRKF